MHRVRLTRYRRAERLDVFDARHPLHALVVVGKCQPQVDAVAGDVARDDGIQDRDREVHKSLTSPRPGEGPHRKPSPASPGPVAVRRYAATGTGLARKAAVDGDAVQPWTAIAGP